MLPPTDTIAAIATARGTAALAIVRASGPEAVAIADRLVPSKALAEAASHTAHVGFLHAPGADGEPGERLDQVVVTLFRAPASATGEDVVEVSCHGGDVVAQRVLGALLDAGARLARPGEFTERAFLNGKLDLAQAEAVADLIHARSTRAQRAAVAHLAGHYTRELDALRAELLQTAALVELELDFSEEDVAFADRTQLLDLLARGAALLDRLVGSYRLGVLARDGVRVVLAGRPNAGKSTLLNALVGDDRAIVSPTPGTTRDRVEAETEIDGLAFRFVDTAGLRATDDAIEAEGVRRSEAAAARADAVIYLYDVTAGLDAEERAWLDRFAQTHPGVPLRLVANHTDRLDAHPDLAPADLPDGTLALSALRAHDDPAELAPLRAALLDAVRQDADAELSVVVTNERHRRHLAAAREAVARADEAVRAGLSGDLVALDLRAALHEIGAITGAVTNEDVLGAIFSQFCIGK